jgi:hypothetical protein
MYKADSRWNNKLLEVSKIGDLRVPVVRVDVSGLAAQRPQLLAPARSWARPLRSRSVVLPACQVLRLAAAAEPPPAVRSGRTSPPRSRKLLTKFIGRAYLLGAAQGEASGALAQSGSPQFAFQTTDRVGVVGLSKRIKIAKQGDFVTFYVELHNPVAMAEGLHFVVHEGARTVGAGVVLSLIT